MSKILVIGNGFDLAHGLPTKYTDFLNFSELFLADDNEYKNKKQIIFPKEGQEKTNFLSNINSCRKSVDNSVNIFRHKFERNNLIKYFMKLYNRKEKWVDFESLLHGYINNITGYFQNQNNYSCLPENIKLLVSTNTSKNNSEIKKIVFNHLRNELDDFIDCLDFYFNMVVYKTRIAKYPLEIYKNMYFDYILSFNYTDTYNRVCRKLDRLQINEKNIHYLHGRTGSTNRHNNMVLGISDFDSDNLDTVYFKKYFQRIQKHTGNKYKKWINIENEIVFMGHSMDITDGDIIKELITKTSKTIIYYYNQSDYEQKVINLIKIFGKEQFEKLYYEQKILFKELSSSVKLSSNKVVLDKMRI